MLAIALLAALATLGGAALIFGVSGWYHHPDQRGRLALAALVAAWPLTFVGTFFNVALAAAASWLLGTAWGLVTSSRCRSSRSRDAWPRAACAGPPP